MCLGLHVAGIDIAVMRRQLTRIPDLAPAGRPEVLASNFSAGMRTMPVSFGGQPSEFPGERGGSVSG